MKRRVSMKSMKTVNTYAVPYCAIQRLLKFQEPFAYSAGTYGWRCDYYSVGDIIISTGYAPVGKQVKYDLCKKWEGEAKNVSSLPWDKQKEATNKLLMQFVEEMKKEA